MPSFDVVSELDKHEVQNAVDNAIKDLDRRYDLKGCLLYTSPSPRDS